MRGRRGTYGSRADVLVALGAVQQRAGHLADARRTFANGAMVARESGDDGAFARAVLGFAGQWAKPGEVDWEIVRLLREALGAATLADTSLRARLLSRLACEYYWTDASELRGKLVEEALSIARRIDDAATLAEVLSRRRHVFWGPDNPDVRLALAREVVEVADGIGDRELSLMGRAWCIVDLLDLGQLQASARELDRYRRMAQDIRQPYFLHTSTALQAAFALREGRFSEAEQLAEAARDMGRDASIESAESTYLCLRASLLRDRGRYEDVLGMAATLGTHQAGISTWRAVLANCYAMMDRIGDATRELDRFACDYYASMPRDFTWLSSMSLLAEACSRLGDEHRAAALYSMLLPYERSGITLGLGVYLGSAAHSLGLLAATMREWASAERHFGRCDRASYEYGSLAVPGADPVGMCRDAAVKGARRGP